MTPIYSIFSHAKTEYLRTKLTKMPIYSNQDQLMEDDMIYLDLLENGGWLNVSGFSIKIEKDPTIVYIYALGMIYRSTDFVYERLLEAIDAGRASIWIKDASVVSIRISMDHHSYLDNRDSYLDNRDSNRHNYQIDAKCGLMNDYIDMMDLMVRDLADACNEDKKEEQSTYIFTTFNEVLAIADAAILVVNGPNRSVKDILYVDADDTTITYYFLHLYPNLLKEFTGIRVKPASVDESMRLFLSGFCKDIRMYTTSENRFHTPHAITKHVSGNICLYVYRCILD
jgi:hypothetical protein